MNQTLVVSVGCLALAFVLIAIFRNFKIVFKGRDRSFEMETKDSNSSPPIS
jgi:hypothetical protein